MLEGAIDAMGKEREEQVLERLADFSDQVVVMVEKLQDVVERFATGRYDELAGVCSRADGLESRADCTKESILTKCHLGGVFRCTGPTWLVLLVLWIASRTGLAGAADRLSMRRFLFCGDECPTDRAGPHRSGSSESCVMQSSQWGATRRKPSSRRQVDKMESRADDVYAAIYHEMFDLDIDFKTFHQLQAIIDRLENIATVVAISRTAATYGAGVHRKRGDETLRSKGCP